MFPVSCVLALGAGGRGLFPDDFLRPLVLAKASKGGMPQPPIAGPLGKLDFTHELRLNPRDAPPLAARRRHADGADRG